ncbi:MAG: hypothetical protein DHS20C14_18960 [Phycisphaeraceae bacterium]|nr:MAG: hypothetical protein DHS20C14_18960 [Phycisphaeraceae bacterium]
MVLLVTTTQALFALDTDRRELTELDRGRGVYYGLAHADDRVWVAGRRWAYGAYPPERAQQRGVIIEYDGAMNERRELEPPFPLRDLHQIHHGHGKLWVCSTFDDMIAVYDPETDAWDRWHPAGVPEPMETPHGPSTDLHHFNSFWHDDASVYALANKKGSGTIHRFDASTLAPIGTTELGAGAHNVWGESGDLFTLSSKDGRLLSTGGTDIAIGGFVRGVVCPPRATALNRYVGVSSRAPRAERATSDAAILEFDADWRPTGVTFPIPGEGMVHDLRAPGTPDLAHPGVVGSSINAAALRPGEPRQPVPETGPEARV